MADKSTEAVLDGLRRAMAEQNLQPLLGTKNDPGLFTGTITGRAAAQRCKDEGYLHVVESEQRGKSVFERCVITEKGVAFLLERTNPRQLLEDFVRAMEAREAQLSDLLALAQRMQQSLEQLRSHAQAVLPRVPIVGATPQVNGRAEPPLREALLAVLGNWHAREEARDCPMPDLFHPLQQRDPNLSIGRFHDELRGLHQCQRIYLHPWTGPLYQLPEPALALLAGHEIAYYVSERR